MPGLFEDLRRLTIFQQYRDLETGDAQQWRDHGSNPQPLVRQVKSF